MLVPVFNNGIPQYLGIFVLPNPEGYVPPPIPEVPTLPRCQYCGSTVPAHRCPSCGAPR